MVNPKDTRYQDIHFIIAEGNESIRKLTKAFAMAKKSTATAASEESSETEDAKSE